MMVVFVAANRRGEPTGKFGISTPRRRAAQITYDTQTPVVPSFRAISPGRMPSLAKATARFLSKVIRHFTRSLGISIPDFRADDTVVLTDRRVEPTALAISP
jgi:hypothetical protein